MFIVFMQYLGFEFFYLNTIENLNQNTGMGLQELVGIRYWGSFGEALSLSTYLTSMSIGLLVYLFEGTTSKSTILVYFCVGFFSIYLTGSRAGLTIFILILFAYLYNNKPRNLLMYLSVLSCGILAIFISNIDKLLLSNSNLSRFKYLKQGDFRYRLWTEGFKIVTESPIYGSTIGCLNYKLKEHALLPSFVERINLAGHAENAYLTMLFSTGLVGFGLFMYIIFYPLNRVKYYQSILDTFKKKELSQIVKSYKYAYISILFCMFFEPSVGINMNSTLHFLLISGVIIGFGNVMRSSLIREEI